MAYFHTKKGLAIKDVSIFYDHLVYFTAFGYILWQYGIFYGCLECFPPFWYVVPRKIWQPCLLPTHNNFQFAGRT
jgi:hypothetical protein